MLNQRTIRSTTQAVGVGLHSGQRVVMTLRAARPNTGIVFRRVDTAEPIEMPIYAEAIVSTRLATTLEKAGAKIHTIEHLMSAICALGIDNLYVDLTAEEVPIFDGSSAAFLYLLQSAGIEIQDEPKSFLKIVKPIQVEEGEGSSFKWARLEPYHGYSLKFNIEFAHPAVDSTGQSYHFDMGLHNYMRDISRARTFGFTKDVEMLRATGLAQGGGLDNAIVLDDQKVLNSDGLRYTDEFVKHKILDAIGDLYVIGRQILGAYSAFKAGHGLNNKLIRAVMASPDCYQLCSYTRNTQLPSGFKKLGLTLD